MRGAVFALLTAVALSALSLDAQGRRAAPPAPTRQAPDLKTTLYYAADALGMLRTPREIDMILTMELWATGSMRVNGQPCRLANYRASVRYRPSEGAQNPRLPSPAMRVDFACAGQGRRSGPRQVQVVAGSTAWDEAEPGKYSGEAPADAATERQLQLWTMIPQSVIKAAAMAGAAATLMDEAGVPVVTFPMPPPFSGTMKAVFNPAVFRVDTNPAGEKRQFSHLIDRTEVRLGSRVIETTYSGYGDLNEADLQALVLLPRRIVQKHDGVTVLDLTVTKTDTVNPYVIVPLPKEKQ